MQKLRSVELRIVHILIIWHLIDCSEWQGRVIMHTVIMLWFLYLPRIQERSMCLMMNRFTHDSMMQVSLSLVQMPDWIIMPLLRVRAARQVCLEVSDFFLFFHFEILKLLLFFLRRRLGRHVVIDVVWIRLRLAMHIIWIDN